MNTFSSSAPLFTGIARIPKNGRAQKKRREDEFDELHSMKKMLRVFGGGTRKRRRGGRRGGGVEAWRGSDGKKTPLMELCRSSINCDNNNIQFACCTNPDKRIYIQTYVQTHRCICESIQVFSRLKEPRG